MPDDENNELVTFFRNKLQTEASVDTSDPDQLLEYLSRAMVQISNLDPSISTSRPHMSLLSGSESDLTLRLYRRNNNGEEEPSSFTPPEVIKICKAWGSGKLGRVIILSDGSAAFDLPKKRAMKLLNTAQENPSDEASIELPSTLPDL